MSVTRTPRGAQGRGEVTPTAPGTMQLRGQAVSGEQAASSPGAAAEVSVADGVAMVDRRGEAIERLTHEVVRLRGERAALTGGSPRDLPELPITLVGLIAESTALGDQIQALRAAPAHDRSRRPGRMVGGRRMPAPARRGLSIFDEDLDDGLDPRPRSAPAIWAVALLVVSLLLAVAGAILILRR